MNRHGSESFFVLGEGLLGEGAGPGEATLAPAVEAETPLPLFADGSERDQPSALGRDARAARVGDGERGRRGFEHPRRVHVPRSVRRSRPDVRQDRGDARGEYLGCRPPPGALTESRPRLALRRRPRRPGLREVLRRRRDPPADGKAIDPNGGFMEGFDLPRGAGTTTTKKRHAIIPDPRNDENLAVAQTHLAMIRFHNRVVDTLRLGPGGEEVPEGAGAGDTPLPVDAADRPPAADRRAL